MGRRDRKKKSYFDDASRFADIFNGYFGGKTFLDAGRLEEADTVLVKADGEAFLERITDCAKKQLKNGSILAVYMMENQLSIDYSMVVRIMLDESMAYDRQVKTIRKQNRGDALTNGEFLYGVKKEDRLSPVVTLVVYWGDEPWNGARSLHELLDFGEGRQEGEKSLPLCELKKYIPDYRINVLDVNTWKDFSVFQTEIRKVFELYTRRNDKKSFAAYAASEECKDLDAETQELICVLTGSRLLQRIQREKRKKEGMKEERGMWKAIEELYEDGREEGRQEGQTSALRNLMQTMHLTAEQAMDALLIPEAMRAEYRATLKKP